MLLKLFIENYALIQKLEINWSNGFSVITGETGAGKSILLGALSLILGSRADNLLTPDPLKKCIVEAEFDISGYAIRSFFREYDLDYADCITVRREILSNSKSRAFINDTPVNLAIMKALGDRLVNIHSQHSIITLNHADFQLDVLDDFAGCRSESETYRQLFEQYTSHTSEFHRLKEKDAARQSEADYSRYLYDELVKANLQSGEQESLESRLTLLSHTEEIKAGLQKSIQLLDNEDPGILIMLNEVSGIIRNLHHFVGQLDGIPDRLESDIIDLKDICSELRHLDDSIQYNPTEIEEIGNRLDLIYRLEKKHQVPSVEALREVLTSLELRMGETEQLDRRMEKLHQQIQQEEKAIMTQARQITVMRKKAIPAFEQEIQILLRELGMPAARFTVTVTQLDKPTPDGYDRIRFLFSANKGTQPEEVAKIASGGELSRLMLSIKSMISRKNLLPTIIFDEIDNGVSGDIAGKVGAILRRMSDQMQVIVITHLPQIAGMGKIHYRVYKEEVEGATYTRIRKLTDDERIDDIAKMLSNQRVTKAAFQTAKELLTNN